MGLTLDECREILETSHTDGALIVTEPNRIYLFGYASTQAAIAITKEGVFYFTDKRYLHEAREKIPAYMNVGEGSIAQAAELLRSCRRIGIEFELSYSLFNFVAAKTGKRGIFSRALRDISPVLKKPYPSLAATALPTDDLPVPAVPSMAINIPFTRIVIPSPPLSCLLHRG